MRSPWICGYNKRSPKTKFWAMLLLMGQVRKKEQKEATENEEPVS